MNGSTVLKEKPFRKETCHSQKFYNCIIQNPQKLEVKTMGDGGVTVMHSALIKCQIKGVYCNYEMWVYQSVGRRSM